MLDTGRCTNFDLNLYEIFTYSVFVATFFDVTDETDDVTDPDVTSSNMESEILPDESDRSPYRYANIGNISHDEN